MSEIAKIITISTAHIPPQMAENLSESTLNTKREDMGVVVHSYDYGFNIYCYSDMRDLQQHKDDIDPVLYRLMEFAQEHDCIWLALDQDGDIEPGLETFDWDQDYDCVSFNER